MGQGKVYISCNYSCTISLLVKILLVKLKYLYIESQSWKNKILTWNDGGTCQNFWALPSQVWNFSTFL